MSWHRVSKREPCPVCGHDSWCSRGEGGAAVCMRAGEGAVGMVECGSAGTGWLHRVEPDQPPPPRVQRQHESPAFTVIDARRVWSAVLARALDDERVEEDCQVWRYLARRRLTEAFERRLLGVLHPSMERDLPPAIATWPGRGFRIVAPLFNEAGELVSLQVRRIIEDKPKTLFPPGRLAEGLVFANDAGRGLLRNAWSGARVVVLGEGLTDSLALAIVTSLPVLAVPGVGSASRVFGAWTRGCTVALALDCDAAGEAAVKPAAAAAFEAGAARLLRVTWPGRCKDACDVVVAKGLDGLGDFLAEHVTRRTVAA